MGPVGNISTSSKPPSTILPTIKFSCGNLYLGLPVWISPFHRNHLDCTMCLWYNLYSQSHQNSFSSSLECSDHIGTWQPSPHHMDYKIDGNGHICKLCLYKYTLCWNRTDITDICMLFYHRLYRNSTREVVSTENLEFCLPRRQVDIRI